MMHRPAFHLLVLAALSVAAFSRPVHADDAARIEKLLKAQGLSPSSNAPANQLGEWDGEWSLEVQGDGANPRFVEANCVPPAPVSPAFKGKQYTFESENRGEWGGTLSVRKGDGSRRALVRDNVVDLIPDDTSLYVFAGLDHLGNDDGAVYIIEDYDTKPRARKLAPLPGTPRVVRFDTNWRGFIVVTRLSISVLRPTGRLEILMVRHAPLNGANSVLPVGDADMLIGMCGAVAHVHFPWRTNRPPDPLDQIPVVTYWARR